MDRPRRGARARHRCVGSLGVDRGQVFGVVAARTTTIATSAAAAAAAAAFVVWFLSSQAQKTRKQVLYVLVSSCSHVA